MIDVESLKKLRQETGVSFAECRKALEETGGNLEQAKEFLRQKGQKIAELKSTRTAAQGIIESYIHPNKKVGVLLDLRCESDFVARSPEFQQLAHEIALQIAAMNPLYVKPDDIPEDFMAGERKIYAEQLANSGKPKKILDEILEGKLNKYREEVSLLPQQWIKDDAKTIQDLINEYIAKIGENILVRKFVRYEV